ncbi:hypothetical protein D9X91_10565 [Falsibacillus albus]|uniref:Uncharacterized protein n=1 Tax=Falsibacillus albus TaxID=2478915 RepID=A0A3L7JX54_9BACI|nr:hypothetical protein D9X91_10565 [Falsibacillus albus]
MKRELEGIRKVVWCPSRRETRADGNQKGALVPVSTGNTSRRESEGRFDARQAGKRELAGIRKVV